MNFAINPVLGETPKFVDLRLLTVNTSEKLNSIFYLVTRAEGLTYQSDWLASRHYIVEVTEGRVSEVQAYRNYIKNSKYETRNIFGRENIQMTRPDQNIQMTRPGQNIQMT